MGSSFLHQLIHSLSKTEKSYYVKRFNNKSPAYKELFDVIAKQKVYNEDLIRKKFSGSYIGNNFPFMKNYLYHAILKSSIQYRAKQKDLNYYFSSIDFLYGKGLHDQCAKLLKQVFKKAMLGNNYVAILKIIDATKLLLSADLCSDDELYNIIKEENTVLKRQHIISTYQNLSLEVKKIGQKSSTLNRIEQVKKINEIKKHPFLRNKKNVIDNYSEVLYHDTLFMIGYLFQDQTLTDKHVSHIQRLITDPNYSKYINIYKQFRTLGRIILYYNRKKDSKLFELNVAKFNELLSANEKDLVQSEFIWANVFTYNSQMHHFIINKKIKKAIQIKDDMHPFYTTYKKLIPPSFTIVIEANHIVIEFLQNNFKQTAKLINQFLHNEELKNRKEVVLSIRLLEIIVFYELNKIDLFESRIKSLKRYIRISKIKEEIWKIFLDFFKELFKNKEVKKSIQTFNLRIKELNDNVLVSNLGYMIDWVNSKQ